MADNTSPPLNIALICNNSLLAGRVEDILASEDFSIQRINTWKEAGDTLSRQSVNAVIGCMNSIDESTDEISSFLSGNQRNTLPVIAITPSHVDIEYFVNALTCGISYQISIPCERKYFISRIREIIALHTKERGVSETIRLEIPESGTRKSIFIHKKQLADNLFSAYRDDIHQKQMLLKVQENLDLLNDADIPPSTEKKDLQEKKRRFSMEMIDAIENGEFELFYQPIVCLKSGSISGFEALIRWNKKSEGFVSPDEFIPYAEETGLIISLGFWVIEEASRQLEKWHKTFTERPPLTISVNLSTVQFIHPGLADHIGDIVTSSGIPNDSLRFEITESALMTDMDSANLMLLKLKNMNFKLYMDDFGTGYSSLSYLRHFPVDVLKIDQSFVRWMGIDDESEEIVHTIINLAHNLKKEVIAEGIETTEHLEKLRELGCEYGQGFLFSRPVNAASAEELIQNNPRW
ncbi:MAG TPA: EAL domain-containing protein [Spirochaetota bacterium]|nr:EAL domain-containing protein [Spirochaetota bacterium]